MTEARLRPAPADPAPPTAEAAASHYALLQALRASGPADPLAADAPTATINNPEWFAQTDRGTIPTPARQALHAQIINAVLAPGESARPGQEPVAVLLAGPPGAGKSTSIQDVFNRGDVAVTGGLSASAFTVIDADSIKGRLIEQARADGSLDSRIKPPAVHALEAKGEAFSDLDLASLVHEESSMIAKEAQRLAMTQRRNVVLDQVCSSPEKTAALVERLSAAGYSVWVVEMHASRDFSLESTFGRYVHTAVRGGTPRRVPTEVVSSVFNQDGSSRPRQVIEQLLMATPCRVSAYRHYDAVEIGKPPQLSELGARNPAGRMLRRRVAAPKPAVKLTKAEVLKGRDARARQLLAASRQGQRARRHPQLGC